MYVIIECITSNPVGNKEGKKSINTKAGRKWEQQQQQNPQSIEKSE